MTCVSRYSAIPIDDYSTESGYWYNLGCRILICGNEHWQQTYMNISNDIPFTQHAWGTRWRSWFRNCATSRKVAGSIPDGVIGIFHWHNPSLTQPLTETSTRNISWGVKTAGAWGRQPYHLHVPIALKCGSLNLLEPSVPVQAFIGTALPLQHAQ
jgi:hypothetical protein